jgi:Putative restriction endonuclease
VEVMLPEWTAIDEDVRWQYYHRHRVLHYWTVNPLTQQVRFWRWSMDAYEEQFVDADGGYRGLDGLTFTPELLWMNPHELYPCLPIVAGEFRSRRWQLEEVETPESLGWDGMPLVPRVDLLPVPIWAAEFVAWCPECKLEGGPLIGGRSGTHCAIAMLLMSLGLVETVKLLPGYEWVRMLRRLVREQEGDAQRREQWWKLARELASQLQWENGIGGVGVIGDLLGESPLQYWSEVHLILWAVPDSVSGYRVNEVDGVPVRMTAVRWASPAEWQLVQQAMTVLVGEWNGQELPELQRRLQFCWLEVQDASN